MSRHGKTGAGFTLFEVLIALAIMTFGLAALWKSLSQSVLVSQALPERVIARWVAQDRITRRQAQEEWPPARSFNGMVEMAGRQWYWQETIEMTEEPLLRRITIEVSRDEQARPIFSFEGFVSRPRLPPAV